MIATMNSMARVPKYPTKPHSSGQARIRLRGKAVYLGKFGSTESQREYHRVISDYLASQQQPQPPPPRPDITVAELIAAHRDWAKTRYQKDGQPTSEVRSFRTALRPVFRLYGHLSANAFGPQALVACRTELVKAGYTRKRINQHVGRIRSVWRWGLEREFVQPETLVGLQAVRGLREGEDGAVSRPKIGPVDPAVLPAIRQHCSPQVYAMLELQRLTGCRPGEACVARTCDFDAWLTIPGIEPGSVWAWRPHRHKGQHHEQERVILIGPAAQTLLSDWLRPDEPEAYLFQPREARDWADQRNRDRCRPDRRSQAGKVKVAWKAKKPGMRYGTRSYSQAVKRACQKAGILPFHPHQLRHTVGTEIRAANGAEIARVILGHSRLSTTEIYAERDLAAAARVVLTRG